MVLAGLSPDIILEIASRALSFFTFQVSFELVSCIALPETHPGRLARNISNRKQSLPWSKPIKFFALYDLM
jgi:hypothetical protein